MNAHIRRHTSIGWKNQPAGFHQIFGESYAGRHVFHGAKVWGGIQWATPNNSGDVADDQDGEIGLMVMWGNPPPAPTSLTPASGKLLATIDPMSQAEGVTPTVNAAITSIGARQDQPIPAVGGSVLVTPDGLDCAVYYIAFFSLTFGAGVYRGMSAWLEAVWDTVAW